MERNTQGAIKTPKGNAIAVMIKSNLSRPELNIRQLTFVVFHALPVTTLAIYLFYYWFAIADRYFVFLYFHTTGVDTSPFGNVTSSRYWMSGLVASGAITVFYAAFCWLLARVLKNYHPPSWWKVWILCTIPLLIGIPLITLTVNLPTLPFSNAAQITLVTLIGTALGLLPGRLSAERPRMLILLMLDGLWIMVVLIVAIGFPYVRQEALDAGGPWTRILVIGFGIAGLWMFIMTLWYVWRRPPIPAPMTIFIAGLCCAYLLMPLVHHVFFTDGYYYISGSDNFFARDAGLQLAIWSLGLILALFATRLRRVLITRRKGSAD